jgi:phosphoribosylamine---glycine ligase
MKILIIGSGGREHALAWKIAQSTKVNRIFVAPGNGGSALENKCENVDIAADDINGLLSFATQERIDLTIVGPEIPLSLGIVDTFQNHELACFGPTQSAAQLESSKRYCKSFLQIHGIPTARFASFTDSDAALDYLSNHSLPVVIKASGLAAGKGVVITDNLVEAQQAVRDMLDDNQFNAQANGIVIEEYLEGEELSFIAMVDGKHVIPLASSQDHKRLNNRDEGPNTGGMGAYSPAPLCTPELQQRIMDTVMQPTVDALAASGTPYVGFLYAGLMISNHKINVLEFNCRLGDPETQPLMMRLESDLIDLCLLALNGRLQHTTIKWKPQHAVSVVMAANGYPLEYPKGDIIQGLNDINSKSTVFHAGTKQKDNETLTAGGRVLAVTALGDTLLEAKKNAYQNTQRIHWPNCHYRTDIADRGLKQKTPKKSKT